MLYADLIVTRGSERPVTTEELPAEPLRMPGAAGPLMGLTALPRTELVRPGERRGAVLVVPDNASGDTELTTCLPPEGPRRPRLLGTVPAAELDEIARLRAPRARPAPPRTVCAGAHPLKASDAHGLVRLHDVTRPYAARERPADVPPAFLVSHPNGPCRAQDFRRRRGGRRVSRLPDGIWAVAASRRYLYGPFDRSSLICYVKISLESNFWHSVPCRVTQRAIA